MAAYCLPKEFASKFLTALKSGAIDPVKLTDMSSAQRRTFFEGIVGADHAEEVNALFESKLLLKNQQAGLVRWAQKIAGISEPARKDLLAKIAKLDKVLQPADEKSFLADLAARKLGVTVTADEAKEIFDLSQKAEAAKAAMKGAGWNTENGTAYGLAEIALSDKVESLKPNGRTWAQLGLEVAGIPRGIKSTLDLSAPLNQGWGMEASGNWHTAFAKMLGYLSDEQNYQNLRGWIRGHPDFELLHDGGLSLTELGNKLSAREEAIQSTLLEKANEWAKQKSGGLIPNAVRASNRSYTGYLNYVRYKTASDMVTAARLAGEDVSAGSPLLKQITSTINNFSGRGDIGGRYDNIVTGLNAVFFSPRKNIANAMMLFDPVKWLNPTTSRFVRVKATKMLVGSILYTAAGIGLLRAMGGDVDLNPISTNFLKAKFGKTSIDITGGMSTFVRFLARMVSGTGISAAGKPIDYGKDQYGRPLNSDPLSQFLHARANVAWQYMLTKLAPGIPSFYADAMYGKDPSGRPFSVTQELRNQLMPMTIDSFVDFAKDDPGNFAAAIPSLLSIIGANMQTQSQGGRGKYGRDVWGETTPISDEDSANKALERVGMTPSFPPKKVRGIPLNDDQYDIYQQLWGRMSRAAIMNVVNQRGFSSLPVGTQEDLIRRALSSPDPNHPGAHEMAQTRLMAKYPHIIVEAAKLKQAQRTMGTAAANAALAASPPSP